MKRFDAAAAQALAQAAAQHPRGRLNLNWHDPAQDGVQRFFNRLHPGSYVRPHRHLRQNRWELTLLLEGAADLLRFDDAGTLLQREPLRPGGLCAVEVPADVWHAYSVPPGEGDLLFEVKPGPYDAALDKVFAAWAPAEQHAEADACRDWLLRARRGERWQAAAP